MFSRWSSRLWWKALNTERKIHLAALCHWAVLKQGDSLIRTILITAIRRECVIGLLLRETDSIFITGFRKTLWEQHCSWKQGLCSTPENIFLWIFNVILYFLFLIFFLFLTFKAFQCIDIHILKAMYLGWYDYKVTEFIVFIFYLRKV